MKGASSTSNLEFVRSLGAHHVIDHMKDDLTRGVERYDVILDTVGTTGPPQRPGC